MSEAQDFSAFAAENQINDPMAVLPPQDQKIIEGTHTLEEVGKTLDGQSYFTGEVPQHHLVDPQAFLPLNSDRLIGSVNMIDKLTSELSGLIQEEINQIQKLQKKISFWEERIDKNK